MQLTGVSRITVREALKILAEVGMIETQKGKGSFVLIDAGTLHPDEAAVQQRVQYRETFLTSSRARLLIEPEIARQAALSATEDGICSLKGLLTEKAPSSTGESIFDDFHRAIAEMTGNHILIGFIDHLLELEDDNPFGLRLIPPEHQKSVSAELNHQHKKILQAIESRNAEFAYFYMKEHLAYLLSSYEDFFARFS